MARTKIEALTRDLAAQPSATAVLQRWCETYRLGDPPRVTAQQKPGQGKPVTSAIRQLLHASPGETIRYRRVELVCGRQVLSRADNWYRTSRLTPAMNAELDATDHPFGVVVRALEFHRETLDSRVLMGPSAVAIPASILRNKALLETPDGEPFSLVVETYTSNLLRRDR